MPLISLDIRTLSFITVLFAFGFGAGLIAFGIVHSSLSGLKRVGIGQLCIGLAFLLIGVRHQIPAILSIVAANTILALGFMLMNLGIRRLRDVTRSDTRIGALIVTVLALLLLHYTYAEPSFARRVFWVGIALFLISGLSYRNILRESAGRPIMPQRILALGFALFGGFMLVRSVWVLNERTMQDFMTASTIHGLAFLAIILLLLTATFGLIWMANERLLQELKQYEQIILSTPEGIALLDREGRYRLVNDALLGFVGLNREDMLGKRSLDLFGRNIYENVTLPNVEKAFAGKTGASSTWIDLPSDERVYVTVSYHPVPGAKGENAFAAIHIKDLTELYYAQKEKQRIFDLSLDMLSVIGMDGSFREVNPAWTRTLGWSQEELLGSQWMEHAHPDDMFKTMDALNDLQNGKPAIDFVNRYRAKDGTYRHIAWMASPDVGNRIIYCVAKDITDWIRKEEELVRLSTIDPLTGANNRRLFMQKLTEEVQRSQRYGTPMSLISLDIDHFKKVNDTYGHAVGDKVLKRFVDTCVATLRSTDIFGRMGGEEFSAILPFADLATAHDTAERLRLALSRCCAGAGDDMPAFTASIGVAEFRPDDTADSLQKRADDALYRAKENGRNRVENG